MRCTNAAMTRRTTGASRRRRARCSPYTSAAPHAGIRASSEVVLVHAQVLHRIVELLPIITYPQQKRRRDPTVKLEVMHSAAQPPLSEAPGEGR